MSDHDLSLQTHPHPEHLGASLYVPAVHPKLAAILAGRGDPALRSVIACTEDAVAESDLEAALAALKEVLAGLTSTTAITRHNSGLARYVRVRNLDVLHAVLAMPGVEHLDGFVLPKITSRGFTACCAALEGRAHRLMPTLETAEVFGPEAMRALCRVLLPERGRIIALRVGGSDLLRLLGMRRTRGMTIYDTPLAAVMAQLMLIFKPEGFALTAPVFDFIDDPALLAEEIRRDRAFGFCGKTAIHPSQVAVIDHGFGIDSHELQAAQRLVQADCPPVFQHQGVMYERAVHLDWAIRLVRRKRGSVAL